MRYYVIANSETQLITESPEEFVKFRNKKTCCRKFSDYEHAKLFLNTFKKIFTSEYVAFIDFEFTCAKKIADYEFRWAQGEVLSIGICIATKEGNIIDTFYSTVKPKYNIKLSSYCKDLTHLTQKEINKSPYLPEVLVNAYDFVKKYKIGKIYAYGSSDYLQTKTNIDYYKKNKDYSKMCKFVNKIVDIQKTISLCLLNQNMEISLADSKKILDISGNVKHNALSDAKDLTKVVFITFYGSPSPKKIKKYLELRKEKIKYNQCRRIKKIQFNCTAEEQNKILSICTLLSSKDVPNIEIKALIDDLLFLSKQEPKYNKFEIDLK